VEDGLAQLRRAFPVHFPSINDFAVDAPSDYPDSSATGYAQIHKDFIDPIARSYALSLRITTALANEFGAHG
jgi:phosphoenolpyruvate carboxylase